MVPGKWKIMIIISLIILIFSAILHEIAHGYVADRLGDPTARLLGRLTLDPRPHIDPMMSIAVPLLLFIAGSPVLFGGAKPVPVDPFNLKEGRKDIALVSLAGPMTNLIIAIVFSVLCHTLFPGLSLFGIMRESFLGQVLATIVQINLSLAIFNLLPIPPLDGSKLFAMLLPERDARTYLSIGDMGTFILFFLLAFPIGPFSLQTIIVRLFSFMLTLLGF
jgi:Zn-dependent protease